MSRKDIFAATRAATPLPAPAARPSALPLGDMAIKTVTGGAGGAINRAFQEAGERAAAAEKKLAEGQLVVELDPSLIDQSFIVDRMETDLEAEASLAEAIRSEGQIVPILVRPKEPGRFEIAYGRRRLRVVAALGRKVRAVVRDLTDEQLAVAQGQENNERSDLSYIEKARFAHALAQRFDRKAVIAALGTHKSHVSEMLSVVERIPPAVVEAIGPAPGVGRPRWIELAEFVKGSARSAVEMAVASEGFAARATDERMKIALEAAQSSQLGTRKAIAKPLKAQKTSKSKPKVLAGEKIKDLGLIEGEGETWRLTVDRKTNPAFATFLAERLPALVKEFERTLPPKLF